MKQIRLRAKTDDHDIDFKVRQAETFLRRKDKVKINVTFRGRENAHHERGREMLEAIVETLKECGLRREVAEHGERPHDDHDSDAQTLTDLRLCGFSQASLRRPRSTRCAWSIRYFSQV